MARLCRIDSYYFILTEVTTINSQSGDALCSRDLFNIILDESFQREGRGWQGLCVAVDLMAKRGLGSKPMHPPLATEVLQ